MRMILALLLVTTCHLASCQGWTDDISKISSTKDTIVMITSDQCIGINLASVSDKALDVTKDFVKVKIDISEPHALSSDVKTLLQALMIEALPTLCFLDEKGRVYAKASGDTDSQDRFVDIVRQALEIKANRDRIFTEAKKKEGGERAKALHEALQLVPNYAFGYSDTVAEIVSLDPDNKAGVGFIYLLPIKISEIMEDLLVIGKSGDVSGDMTYSGDESRLEDLDDKMSEIESKYLEHAEGQDGEYSKHFFYYCRGVVKLLQGNLEEAETFFIKSHEVEANLLDDQIRQMRTIIRYKKLKAQQE